MDLSLLGIWNINILDPFNELIAEKVTDVIQILSYEKFYKYLNSDGILTQDFIIRVIFNWSGELILIALNSSRILVLDYFTYNFVRVIEHSRLYSGIVTFWLFINFFIFISISKDNHWIAISTKDCCVLIVDLLINKTIYKIRFDNLIIQLHFHSLNM